MAWPRYAFSREGGPKEVLVRLQESGDSVVCLRREPLCAWNQCTGSEKSVVNLSAQFLLVKFNITALPELTLCKLIYYVLLTKAPSTQDRVCDAVSLHELEVEMLEACVI